MRCWRSVFTLASVAMAAKQKIDVNQQDPPPGPGQVKLYLENHLDEKVELFWVSPEGKYVPQTSLPADSRVRG